MAYIESVTGQHSSPSPALLQQVDRTRLPRHIALVMDGNGRWAQQRGLPRTDGHVAGEDALMDCVETAIELGVEWMTAYAFSTENWNRPIEEVRFLMNFNEETLRRRESVLHEKNVKMRFIGRRGGPVPARVQANMDGSVELTKHNTGLNLCIAFNYGGRAELVDAVRAIVESGVAPGEVTEGLVQQHLYVPEAPEVDLFIRSSGETRVSNFLLWELAYAEMIFSPLLWPDFRGPQLVEAITEFQHRSRRFGGLDPAGASSGGAAGGPVG